MIVQKGRAALLRLATVIAVMLIVVTTGAAPARAAQQNDCQVVAGTISPALNWIELCVVMNWTGNHFATYTKVIIQPGVNTSATNCKVTVYLDLKVDNGTPWSTAKNTKSCDSSIDRPGESYLFFHYESDTAANWWRGHVCADLYYNYSSSSGWQRCITPGWWVV